MFKLKTVSPLLVLGLLLLGSCGKSSGSEAKVDSLTPDSRTNLLTSEVNLGNVLAEGESDVSDSSTGVGQTPVIGSDEPQEQQGSDSNVSQISDDQKAKMKELDKKFMDKFKTLSQEERKALLKKINGVLKKLKGLSEEERKVALKAMKPPLPSKKVLDKILKKPQQKG